jgi:hypothetical protein
VRICGGSERQLCPNNIFRITHHSSDGLEEDPGGCSVMERTGLFGVDDMSL